MDTYGMEAHRGDKAVFLILILSIGVICEAGMDAREYIVKSLRPDAPRAVEVHKEMLAHCALHDGVTLHPEAVVFRLSEY